MIKTIYKLPVPSTALLKDPIFEERIKRTGALICEYESETEDKIVILTMVFENLAAFKCSYYGAQGSEMSNAYSKVINFGLSKWLIEVKDNLMRYEMDSKELSHLAIYFDDGPTFEFICRGFRTETELKSYESF